MKIIVSSQEEASSVKQILNQTISNVKKLPDQTELELTMTLRTLCILQSNMEIELQDEEMTFGDKIIGGYIIDNFNRMIERILDDRITDDITRTATVQTLEYFRDKIRKE